MPKLLTSAIRFWDKLGPKAPPPRRSWHQTFSNMRHKQARLARLEWRMRLRGQNDDIDVVDLETKRLIAEHIKAIDRRVLASFSDTKWIIGVDLAKEWDAPDYSTAVVVIKVKP